MSVKYIVSLCAAALIGFTISPSYSHDIISCDGLENCPDGSVPLTNTLLAMQAEIDELTALLAGVTRGTDPNTSQDTLTFTNMNVQIVSGSGTTNGETTGTGNMIIGYNNLREGEEGPDDRDGSHMLVIGDKNNYTADSYGGMVVGSRSETSAPYASVSGGHLNIASYWSASVSGGSSNIANGEATSVSGGHLNIASGALASVCGGQENLASGTVASVSGGSSNIASNDSAWVGGGSGNTSSGLGASVLGGEGNIASGGYATVSGGNGNTASGGASSVSGGHANEAIGSFASVSGGGGRSAEADYCWEGDSIEEC